jgi:hypothetical protein
MSKRRVQINNPFHGTQIWVLADSSARRADEVYLWLSRSAQLRVREVLCPVHAGVGCACERAWSLYRPRCSRHAWRDHAARSIGSATHTRQRCERCDAERTHVYDPMATSRSRYVHEEEES